ncbi:MAG TPA: hypothetical protein VGQ59_18015 [Cyclobacteriaceae bacterium]|jgi:hypothetical protein|nr:hypothetical protein [Cyclobacteriaceae bacterium]
MKQLIFLALVLTTVYGKGQNRIFGRYCRGVLVADYRIKTVIDLNSDSTFNYEIVGHTIQETTWGNYSMSNDNFIELTFPPLESGEFVKLELDRSNRKLKFKNDKLFELNRKGHIIRAKRLPSLHRRFYLFGDYTRKRKVYLIRESNKDQCN